MGATYFSIPQTQQHEMSTLSGNTRYPVPRKNILAETQEGSSCIYMKQPHINSMQPVWAQGGAYWLQPTQSVINAESVST